jgi:hypothetical protein
LYLYTIIAELCEIKLPPYDESYDGQDEEEDSTDGPYDHASTEFGTLEIGAQNDKLFHLAFMLWQKYSHFPRCISQKWTFWLGKTFGAGADLDHVFTIAY